MLSLLAATPARLAELTAGLAPEELADGREPGAWSARDVLVHLRACAQVWGGCVTVMLAEDHPTLRAVNPRTWLERTGDDGLAFGPSLQAFTTQRAGLLAVLEPLPPEGWKRSATVTGAGRPLERTVLSYAERLATHERQHLGQVERTVQGLRPQR